MSTTPVTGPAAVKEAPGLDMTASLVIPPRFCGPPDSANGGYASGLIAARLGGQAEITLRRPPPLDRPMTVERAGEGSVRVLDGDVLIAEGTSSPGDPALELPGPVTVRDARAAGLGSRLRAHPDEHPFPTCFVCGPARRPPDGLGVMPGPVAGRGLSADAWYPDESLAPPGGELAPELVWAALDCAGGIGALADTAPDGPPYVLGRLAARQLGPVRTGEPHVVAGWRLAAEGRKLHAGSALFTATGKAVGIARATWIRLG
jgi:hypothetical protein